MDVNRPPINWPPLPTNEDLFCKRKLNPSFITP